MIRVLKDNYPNSNVVAIDYDPSATEINQENRIKLMLANAASIAGQHAAREVPLPRHEEEYGGEPAVSSGFFSNSQHE